MLANDYLLQVVSQLAIAGATARKKRGRSPANVWGNASPPIRWHNIMETLRRPCILDQRHTRKRAETTGGIGGTVCRRQR
jgi:hypothetical protein